MVCGLLAFGRTATGEQDRQERLLAKRRARKCVRFLYYAIKVVGVAACVFTSGLNLALVYMRPDFRREMGWNRVCVVSYHTPERVQYVIDIFLLTLVDIVFYFIFLLSHGVCIVHALYLHDQTILSTLHVL